MTCSHESLPTIAPGPAPRRGAAALLGRFARDRRGVTAIEFSVLAMPFFGVLFSMFEIGMTYTADALLQNAVTETARMIRTGEVQADKIDEKAFRNRVCERIDSFLQCDGDTLQIEVAKFSSFANANPSSPRDGAGELRDNFGYDPGGACDIIMVRGFYKWEPITPGLGYFMEQLPGDYILEARAVVRNEPFTTSLAGC